MASIDRQVKRKRVNLINKFCIKAIFALRYLNLNLKIFVNSLELTMKRVTGIIGFISNIFNK